MVESRHHSELNGLGKETGFRFCWRDVADRLEQAAMVEPVDPFQRCELDSLEAAPGAAAMDDLGLEQTDHGLGQGIVIAVANAANRRLDTGFGQAFSVLDRHVLAAP